MTNFEHLFTRLGHPASRELDDSSQRLISIEARDDEWGATAEALVTAAGRRGWLCVVDGQREFLEDGAHARVATQLFDCAGIAVKAVDDSFDEETGGRRLHVRIASGPRCSLFLFTDWEQEKDPQIGLLLAMYDEVARKVGSPSRAALFIFPFGDYVFLLLPEGALHSVGEALGERRSHLKRAPTIDTNWEQDLDADEVASREALAMAPPEDEPTAYSIWHPAKFRERFGDVD